MWRRSAILLLLLVATAAAPVAEPPVELEEHRTPTLVTRGDCFLRGGTLLTVTRGVIEGGAILVRKGKIAAIGRNLTPPAGVPVIDATGRWITPGIIDAHSHIAADAINEGTDSITAEVRIADVLNPEHLGIYRALAGGVTAALILHGSANTIGGQSSVIKLKWRRPVAELLVPDAPRIIKFALGENVKRSSFPRGGDTPRFPTTRMGVESVLRRGFEEAKRYSRAWERYERERQSNPDALPPRRDLRLETLADVLRGKIWVHCHAYRADEMLMLMRLAKEYGFKIAAFQHALEAYRIAPELAQAGIGVSTFSDAWSYKIEAFEAIPYNAALCREAGIVTSINSDDAERMRRLNLDAAKSIRYGGLSEEDALKLVTLYPAQQLGIAHRTGALEVGKDADLALWDAHPLSVYARCVMTLVEGEVRFQRRDAFGLDQRPATDDRRPTTDDRRGGLVGPLEKSNRPVAPEGRPSARRVPSVGHRSSVVGRCPADHLALRPPPAGRRYYAVVGATVHPVSGPDISGGVVLMEGERIRAVGGSVSLPSGTHVLDGRGLHVYPGLIDAGSEIGLIEVGSVRGTVDTSEGGELQPDALALTAVHPASEHLAVTRFQGITAALTRPAGGMVAGQSALVNLSGWTPEEMRVRSPVALHVNFPQGLTSLPHLERLRLPADDRRKRREEDETRMRRLRELFDRAKRYAATRSKAPDETPYDPRLAAMAPYVAGQRPVVISADSAAAIREALQFAEEVGVKPILASGREAWKVADLLARKRVPVIYGPVYALPYREEDPYDSPYAAPALLHRAGVSLCFQSADAAMARDLPYQVGIACAYGLPREAGLRALTLDAARILGAGDVMGSLEPGKLANVMVTDGDPLEPTTSLHALFIAGKPIPLESKHTRLYHLYRERLSPVRSRELAR